LDADIVSEIHKLREIRPHAVITTNYDQFLSRVYPDYERIVGREVLGSKSLAIGEIFQIHGSTSNPESLVLTTDDYVAFEKNKKFIAAKLLTLFSVHPLLIAGYSVADSNVKELFADIDLALGSPGELLENIYYLEFKKDVDRQTSFPSEKMIQVASNRSVRVKLIQAERFGWVYNAFKAPEFMEPVSPKILRAFMARAKQLTRVDIPRQKVQADFQMLAERVDSQENFVSLLGIASIDEATQLSALYPWNATELASQLGLSHWSKAYKLIDQIKAETGVDIRTFDNEYHRRQRYGKQRIPLYSPGCKALLQRVQSGEKITKEWLDIGI